MTYWIGRARERISPPMSDVFTAAVAKAGARLITCTLIFLSTNFPRRLAVKGKDPACLSKASSHFCVKRTCHASFLCHCHYPAAVCFARHGYSWGQQLDFFCFAPLGYSWSNNWTELPEKVLFCVWFLENIFNFRNS